MLICNTTGLINTHFISNHTPMIFYAHIKDGKLVIGDRKKMAADIATLSDSRVQISIHPIGDPVSTRLRKYYWALCRLIAAYWEDLGYPNKTAEQVHSDNKKQYMTRHFMNYGTGETYPQEQSHMNLTNAQIIDMCQKLQVAWAERGLYLPDPNEELKQAVNDHK